jgi:threonine/homoserine/homoserine lactone efflux protein
VYVSWLAWESFAPMQLSNSPAQTNPNTWNKAFLTNILSPSPWLFWFTVGAASFLKAKSHHWIAVALFLIVFYVCLCGSKILLAIIADQARPFLGGKVHRLILRLLGLALALFSVLLFRDGLKYFGFIC